MKFLIASDLHGSKYYLDKLLEAVKLEKPNKIVFLGDIYYHGPRNPLPKDYSPKDVANLLNEIKKDIIVIKGNCDSEVDTLVSEFDFINDMVITINSKTFFLTHGHVYNKDNMPKTTFDGIIYGHFHTGFIDNKDGVIIANPGSLSLPKENTLNSYLILDEESLTLKDIESNLIKRINL